MSKARVAILIPVYRAQRLLDRTLEALRDDNSEFDVIVVDDGSEPAIHLGNGYPFPITLIRLDENGGVANARNIGLRTILSRGFDFVALLDAGDIHVPGRLEAQKDFLLRHTDHSTVGTAYQIFSEEGEFLYEMHPPCTDEQIKNVLPVRNVFCNPSVMFNCKYLDTDLLYEKRLKVGSDYDIFYRLSKTTKLANLPDTFVRCVIDGKGLTAKRKLRYINRIKIQWKYFDPRNRYCYIGIMRSLLMCLVPYRLRRDVYAYFTRLTRAAAS